MYYTINLIDAAFSNQMIEGYDYGSVNSVNNLIKLKYDSKSHINLESFKLRYKDNWTDVISSHLNFYFGILLSDKLLKVCKDFKIIDHEIKKAKVDKGKKEINYNCLFFNKSAAKFIDFKKSDFHFFYGVYKGSEQVTDYVSLKSFLCESVYSSEFNYLRSNEIVLNKGFDYDLFTIFNISKGIVVSEELKNEIEKLKLLGIRFEKAPIQIEN